MSMKISGDGPFKPLNGLDGARKSESTANSKKTESAGNCFADALRDAATSANLSAPTGGQDPRGQKVQALKAQIANGTYNPDAFKVSEKLISFISDNLA